jgi:hypothetical protein
MMLGCVLMFRRRVGCDLGDGIWLWVGFKFLGETTGEEASVERRCYYSDSTKIPLGKRV